MGQYPALHFWGPWEPGPCSWVLSTEARIISPSAQKRRQNGFRSLLALLTHCGAAIAENACFLEQRVNSSPEEDCCDFWLISVLQKYQKRAKPWKEFTCSYILIALWRQWLQWSPVPELPSHSVSWLNMSSKAAPSVCSIITPTHKQFPFTCGHM